MSPDETPTTDTETGSPFASLLALQDADLHVDQLRHRRAHLPEREAIAANDLSRTKLGERVAAIETERRGHLQRQEELEVEIAESDTRVGRIEERLKSASAGSFRDQEAMAVEIGSLQHRKTELEDHEIEVMEALEPLDAELSLLVSSLAELDASRTDLSSELAMAETAIDTELAALIAERATLSAAVATPLLEEYERLRSKFGGIGVSRLVHGTCSGCNLSLPATEIDAIRHAPAGTMNHCDQCGRIIVP